MILNPSSLRAAGLLAAAVTAPLTGRSANAVDFFYSPPKWQTAICLPDDPYKSLVDSTGTLLYHYERENFKESEREFGTRISVETAPGARQGNQRLLSPRVPIVQTSRTIGDLEVLEEAFAVTDLARAGARNDVILVHVTNRAKRAQTIAPRLVVDTGRAFVFDAKAQQARVNDHEVVTASLRMAGCTEESKGRHVIQLAAMEVPAGGTGTYAVQYHGGSTVDPTPAERTKLLASRAAAVAYWEKAPLPYGRVQVPDAGVQALVDSAIRNIWQAREIKNGRPVFQVGPTCYRGLWIVDGAFLLETATMLGAGAQARNGIAHELIFQKPSGRILVMEDFPKKMADGSVEWNRNFTKENGIVLWTCVRHAQLTQDKAWLESVWPKLVRVAEYIRQLRRETLSNDTPLDDGLIPPGFADGGIWGTHAEYTNVYWNLVGLKAFVSAARWLGKDGEASAWQKEFDDFMQRFRQAAQRDFKTDLKGNRYLPIRMDGKDLPQRGQWAFLHAVYPGQLFDGSDPLVTGNMAMLEATEREGMVYGTGWVVDGIWNYFGSFYGHAWLWLGNGANAFKALHNFGNHAAPTLVWREEQSLKGTPFEEFGDMPHNWASAEFIRLTVHLLAIDRGSEIHLFEGLPPEWTQAGAKSSLTGLATPFGPLTMSLTISADRRSAQVRIDPLADPSCSKIVVHVAGWAGKTAQSPLELDPRQAHTLELPITR